MDEFCDPVIVMAEGLVLATGTMAALRARSDVVEASLVQADPPVLRAEDVRAGYGAGDIIHQGVRSRSPPGQSAPSSGRMGTASPPC